MGLKLKDLVIKKEIEISDLKGRKIVMDSFNILYQFLTTIRMRDGSLLMDSKGNVTSHLTGLFSRTTSLLQKGVKPAFVFDGKPPKLKYAEKERRKELKEKARKEYEVAKSREDLEEMKKHAARTTVLTREMVEEAKKLIDALGLPIIQAPSEGEAQAAFMVREGDAYAEASQDYDCLMYGAVRLVRNLTVSEKRKVPGKLAYVTVKPEMIGLEENLSKLGISQDQLIILGILIGTDYNPNGIKGIGPKNALKLIKKHGDDSDSLFREAEWEKYFDFSWQEVFEIIKKMPVTEDYALEFKPVDKEKVFKLLVDKHDFSEERIKSALEKLSKESEKRSQKGLGDFFG